MINEALGLLGMLGGPAFPPSVVTGYHAYLNQQRQQMALRTGLDQIVLDVDLSKQQMTTADLIAARVERWRTQQQQVQGVTPGNYSEIVRYRWPHKPQVQGPTEWLCGYCRGVQPVEHRHCENCSAPRSTVLR